MTPEQRALVVSLLQKGETLPREWATVLFPPERREYELVYGGKEREEDVLAETLAVPLQAIRNFGGDTGPGAWRNKLIFGDNLQVLKALLDAKHSGALRNADGSDGVRLVYIDPPFATLKEFRGPEEQKAYLDKLAGARFLEFLRKRLVLLREILHPEGSIYVHLDTRKSHYVKVMMDEVFGEERFLNEIVWRRSTSHASAERYGAVHDALLFYSKSPLKTWTPPLEPLDPEYIAKYFRYDDGDGRKYWLEDATGEGDGPPRKFGGRLLPPPPGRHFRWVQEKIDEYWAQNRLRITEGNRVQFKRYLDETDGKAVGDVWTDIKRINQVAKERLQYPTQKPEALLERIINASSSPGDIVLDAFAGAGTACAVAEKLGRRWIGIDCGKLSVYTIQKRLLNLKEKIGNTGAHRVPKPFTLYHAGLYDFSRLKELNWENWRFFALQLFQCRDEPHRIGGLNLDGYLRGASVLVFNHFQHRGAKIDEETIRSLHEAVGGKIGGRLFIVAPALSFDFQQDYVHVGDTRYYALRIPYSIIHELHRRDFTALRQPSDETAVNETVEAVGFDFIRTPELEFDCGAEQVDGKELARISVSKFVSDAVVRNPLHRRGNLETLSMVMLDHAYDEELHLFDLDSVHYAAEMKRDNWTLHFPAEELGAKVMAVFVDLYGNEARVVIPAERFTGTRKTSKVAVREASANRRTSAKSDRKRGRKPAARSKKGTARGKRTRTRAHGRRR